MIEMSGTRRQQQQSARNSSGSTTSTNRRAVARRRYAQVAVDDDDAVVPNDENADESRDGDSNSRDSDDATILTTVTILDFTQKKFPVQLPTTATIGQLKQRGAAVHKVPADRQRLIYQGKLLEDDKTLQEYKLINDEGTAAAAPIVHLFPKPRVVIKNDASHAGSTTTGAPGDDNNDDNHDDSAARIPTVVYDTQEDRASILVLGSPDYIEAQNSVKLFSFMLLIISSVELLNLTAIAMGVPQNAESAQNGYANNNSYGPSYPSNEDDIFPPDFTPSGIHNDTANGTSMQNNDSVMYQEWTAPNWFDLLVSVGGVYVALLGLRATNENTWRLASMYLHGTIIVGIGWLLFNYYMSYEIDKEIDQERQEAGEGGGEGGASNNNNSNIPGYGGSDVDDESLAYQAFSVMVLPGLVWFLCCLRAWQFQHLLHEAEQEATERMASQLVDSRDDSRPDEELALHETTAAGNPIV